MERFSFHFTSFAVDADCGIDIHAPEYIEVEYQATCTTQDVIEHDGHRDRVVGVQYDVESIVRLADGKMVNDKALEDYAIYIAPNHYGWVNPEVKGTSSTDVAVTVHDVVGEAAVTIHDGAPSLRSLLLRLSDNADYTTVIDGLLSGEEIPEIRKRCAVLAYRILCKENPVPSGMRRSGDCFYAVFQQRIKWAMQPEKHAALCDWLHRHTRRGKPPARFRRVVDIPQPWDGRY